MSTYYIPSSLTISSILSSHLILTTTRQILLLATLYSSENIVVRASWVAIWWNGDPNQILWLWSWSPWPPCCPPIVEASLELIYYMAQKWMQDLLVFSLIFFSFSFPLSCTSKQQLFCSTSKDLQWSHYIPAFPLLVSLIFLSSHFVLVPSMA